MSSSAGGVVVIGGGLVGLATAYRILQADPGRPVTVLEKERSVAEHQSGRNSGVLHSGIYYRPGSLRAELCTRGKRELEEYADGRKISVRSLGKVVVAVERNELPRLDGLLERGRANGIAGLEMLGQRELLELEPHVSGLRALRVPGTSVIDFREVAVRLSEDVVTLGGQVHLGEAVTAIRRVGRDRVVVTSSREIPARVVVGCAGLQSDRVARTAGMPTPHRIVPFRGTFRALRRGGERLVNGLVYPVPDPSLPFLGVHFTPQTDGSVRIGPNAVVSLSREGRSRGSVSLRDLADWLGYPGFWRLARRHVASGAAEVWRDVVDRALLRACRRYVPELRAEHLGPPFSGVRAQLLSRRGELLDDFVLGEAAGLILVLNAPSPAATACLSIGGRIAQLATAQLARLEG